MSSLLSFAVVFALGCYAVASVLVLVRLVGGPRAQDRVFALDLLYFHGMLVMLEKGPKLTRKDFPPHSAEPSCQRDAISRRRISSKAPC